MNTFKHMDAAKITDGPTAFKLSYSKEGLRQTFRTLQGTLFHKVIVGAVIFRDDKILLLKRVATETHYPNVFELPSGHVDEAIDPTLGDSLLREIKEETGLEIKKVTGELHTPLEYETFIIVDNLKYVNSCVQFNYLVEVEDGEVICNPEAHSEYKWASKEELDNLDNSEMTSDMYNLVVNAFRNRED